MHNGSVGCCAGTPLQLRHANEDLLASLPPSPREGAVPSLSLWELCSVKAGRGGWGREAAGGVEVGKQRGGRRKEEMQRVLFHSYY